MKIYMRTYIKSPKGKKIAEKSMKKYINSPKGKESQKKYKKEHPEILLKANKNLLDKLGKIFDMNRVEYNFALISWSKTVKNRDNHECQICGSKENIQAHHILHKMKYPELSLNINNGITLCEKPCHYEVHGKQEYLLTM